MYARLRPLLCAGLILGLGTLIACDTPPAKKDDAAAKADGKEASKDGAAEATKDEGVPFDACLASCNDPKLSADDKATCRLNCKADDAVDRRKVGAAADGSPSAKDVLKSFDGCAGKCAGDDAAACSDACVAEVSGAETTVTTLKTKDDADAGAIKACAKGCLTAMVKCDGDCAGKGSADDQATCHLNCQEPAAVCLEGCGGT
ncbi:MAG: hypothetical protein R3A79_04780 [Nannocystaceae bacterium]